MPRPKTSTPPPPMAVVEPPPYVSATTVQSIYASLLEALKTGMETDKALNAYMPLLLNELDKLLVLPEDMGHDVFKTIFYSLWERWFPEIPAPSITERDSAMTVFAKTRETLAKHWDKLPGMAPRIARPSSEVEAHAERLVLYFFNSVLSAVFTAMGLKM